MATIGNSLKDASHLIKVGGLVVYPTETLYALGADPYNRLAVLKVFGAKQRGMEKPLSVAVSSLDEADELVFVNEAARKVAGEFLPGPVTIVLKKKARLPKELTAGFDTLGIRIPNNQIALDFIEMAGPITATSANISGKSPPTTLEEAKSQMGNDVDYIINGGECTGKVQSTVIDLSDPENVTILREGAIPEDDIRKLLNKT